MFNALGEDRSKGLLMFHSLTGCDTTTGILGITKHTAFQKWLDIVVKDSYILAPMNTMTCHDLTAINFDYNQQKEVIERFISRIHRALCRLQHHGRYKAAIASSQRCSITKASYDITHL